MAFPHERMSSNITYFFVATCCLTQAGTTVFCWTQQGVWFFFFFFYIFFVKEDGRPVFFFFRDRISMMLMSLIFRLSCLSGEEGPRGGARFHEVLHVCILMRKLPWLCFAVLEPIHLWREHTAPLISPETFQTAGLLSPFLSAVVLSHRTELD